MLQNCNIIVIFNKIDKKNGVKLHNLGYPTQTLIF